MKRLVFQWMMVLLVIGLSVSSHAALIDMQDSSGHVVYDDQSGRYWIWDLSAYTYMTYDQQLSAIADMNDGSTLYYGIDTWHMATSDDMVSLFNMNNDYSTIAESFNPNVTYYPDYFYWAGRYNVATPEDIIMGEHQVQYLRVPTGVTGTTMAWTLGIDDNESGSLFGAWVTSDAVPVPAAIWLFASGLIGLVGIRRRLNK